MLQAWCLTQGSCNKTMRLLHHHHHHHLNHQHNDDLRQPHLQFPTMPGVEQGWVRLHGHWCNMSWWLHNGCGWTEVLHFEVKIIIMSCYNFISIDGVDNDDDDANDDEETWDLTATLQLLCRQEPDFVPPVFFFPRKGQSSWSDANSRCQSEGDDSLAIITFVRSILWKKRLVWIKNLQLFCDWAAHFKEREWEHCSADGSHPAHWQGLYRPHRFGHRGEQTMREGFQNTVTDHPSKWPSIKKKIQIRWPGCGQTEVVWATVLGG